MKISILIPSINGFKLLSECVNSIFEKMSGEHNVEVIIKLDFGDETITKINELKNTKNSIDLMAIKYLARITGKSMDKVVSWFIFILIFVFDPSAIGLLMVFNQMVLDKNKIDKIEIIEPKQKKKVNFAGIFESGLDGGFKPIFLI